MANGVLSKARKAGRVSELLTTEYNVRRRRMQFWERYWHTCCFLPAIVDIYILVVTQARIFFIAPDKFFISQLNAWNNAIKAQMMSNCYLCSVDNSPLALFLYSLRTFTVGA